MNAVTLIVVIAVLWVLRELIVGYYVRRSRRKYREEYRTERAQSHFAAARNDLMRLAIAGEIDVDSASFRRFYFINTALMRRPDQYPQFSQAITRMILDSRGLEPDEELVRESKRWTREFRAVVTATANALDYILLDYSRLVRLMFRMEKIQDPESNPSRMLTKLAKKLEEKERTISDIRRTQKAMHRMASI